MSERHYSLFVKFFYTGLSWTYAALSCDYPQLGQISQKTSTTQPWSPVVSPDCHVVTLVDQRDYKSVAQHVVFKMFLSVCSTVESADWLTPGCSCVKTDPTPLSPAGSSSSPGGWWCSACGSLTSNKKVHQH